MTERLPDRWHSRDFPVLLETARAIDDNNPPNVEELALALSQSERHVTKALEALHDAGYLRVQWLHTFEGSILDDAELTERGRRAVGLWPSGDDAAEALADALRQAEESVSDPEEKRLIHRARGQLLTISRDVMADVLAAVVRQQTGL